MTDLEKVALEQALTVLQEAFDENLKRAVTAETLARHYRTTLGKIAAGKANPRGMAAVCLSQVMRGQFDPDPMIAELQASVAKLERELASYQEEYNDE